MSATRIFLGLPDLQKLCCVVATLQENNIEDPRSRQRITCRELVLLHSDVLACPGLDSFDYIQVVMALGPPQCVSLGVLQCCLSFSLTTRLAPTWNKAGSYLVAGKDFLGESKRLEAISMELSTTDGELCLSLRGTTVTLPPTTLQDFDLPPLVRSRFCRDTSSVLDPSPSGQPLWCHVLPSMKKGQIMRISRQLPPDGPFSSYRDLQVHWRRLYGYQLPDLQEDNVVYCHVYFMLLGEKLFSYPLSCILLQPIKPWKPADHQGALYPFLADVREKLQTVCGFNIRLTSKPRQRREATAEVDLVTSARRLLSHHHLPPPPPPPPLVPLSWSQPSLSTSSSPNPSVTSFTFTCSSTTPTLLTSTASARMLPSHHHRPPPPPPSLPPPLVPLSWSQPHPPSSPSTSTRSLTTFTFTCSSTTPTFSTSTASAKMLLSHHHHHLPPPPLPLVPLSWCQPLSPSFSSSSSTTPPKAPASPIPKVVPTFSTAATIKQRHQVRGGGEAGEGGGGGAKRVRRVSLPLNRNQGPSSSASSFPVQPPPFVPVFGRRPKPLVATAASPALKSLRGPDLGHSATSDPALEQNFKFPPKKLPRRSARCGGPVKEKQASGGPTALTALHHATSRGVRSASARLDVKLRVKISLSQENLNQKVVSSLTQV